MEDFSLQNIIYLVVGGLIGSGIQWLFGNISNKTSVLKYIVETNNIGVSTDDKTFGSVRVTWQDNNVRNLYITNFVVENGTSKDFENIKFKIYSGDNTLLLNESAVVVDEPYVIPKEEHYEERLHIPKDHEPNQQQIDEYYHSREYELGVFNRGKRLKFSYLCTNPNDDNPPEVFISTPSKGIRLKQNLVPYLVMKPLFGVSVTSSIIVALLLSAVVVILSGLWIKDVWIVASICMIFGLTGQVFAALFCRIFKFLRDLIAG
ncbi:hypothetical protein [Emcibacter nanhaiensis]|uniref:Uncharacterized protein n=1 Tax=Emcibacter nanhaiensis TaxID=1505037 RepID=A0A501PPP0_9PROT|nr:hypothetical protein [Emcibacter nanhaiensis]TPD61741.1 hypothetical protein FIV46_05915 [Emcibacter nanhaiensis]